MAVYYRGAGVGTHWNNIDAMTSGFTPKEPGGTASVDRIMLHIARADVKSPYISLTASFGIAYYYAQYFGVRR